MVGSTTFRSLVHEAMEAPPEDVLLLHGTSSAKAEKFASQGILVPRGNVKEYMVSLVLGYLAPVGITSLPEEAIGEVDSYIYMTRSSGSAISTDGDKCIYATLKFELADYYADEFSSFGSEMNNEAFRIALRCLRYSKSGITQEIQPRFVSATPLIVGFVVPVSSTSIDKNVWKGRFRDFLERREGLTTYQSYVKTFLPKSEVRVYRDIPPGDLIYGIDSSSDLDREVTQRIGV